MWLIHHTNVLNRVSVTAVMSHNPPRLCCLAWDSTLCACDTRVVWFATLRTKTRTCVKSVGLNRFFFCILFHNQHNVNVTLWNKIPTFPFLSVSSTRSRKHDVRLVPLNCIGRLVFHLPTAQYRTEQNNLLFLWVFQRPLCLHRKKRSSHMDTWAEEGNIVSVNYTYTITG